MTNQVILNKDASTWPRIKKYWEDRHHSMDWTEGFDGLYYGFIDCIIGGYCLDRVQESNAEIIELPDDDNEIQLSEDLFIKHFEKFRHGIYRASLDSFLETGKLSGSLLLEVREMLKLQPKEEKKYPRVMWVWQNAYEQSERVRRVVLFEFDGKFICPESVIESIGGLNSLIYSDDDETMLIPWDNAKDIEPEIEVTLEEIAAWKGVSKEQVKVKQ